MATEKRQLIIIPGLGDRVRLYRLVIPVWKLLGYDVHIFSFGWEDVNEDFQAAIKRLVDYIDDLRATRVSIIGASAGGTAAINVLAERPQTVRRVVTIATPYRYLAHLENEKLKDSIDHIDLNANSIRLKILSTYGLRDQTVPPNISKPRGIYTKKLYAVNHGYIIAIALVAYCLNIRKFLERK